MTNNTAPGHEAVQKREINSEGMQGSGMGSNEHGGKKTRRCESHRLVVCLQCPSVLLTPPTPILVSKLSTDMIPHSARLHTLQTKYRIHLPVCSALSLPTLDNLPAQRAYIVAEYGQSDALYLDASDTLFRHSFDGNDADGFYDAVSCICGHLTSLWDWYSSL